MSTGDVNQTAWVDANRHIRMMDNPRNALAAQTAATATWGHQHDHTITTQDLASVDDSPMFTSVSTPHLQVDPEQIKQCLREVLKEMMLDKEDFWQWSSRRVDA